MLHFIYRDSLVEDELVASSSSSNPSEFDSLTAKLLAAADRYELGRLRRMCESYLCKEISVNSVGKTLALADRYHAAELKAVCLRFAAENLAGNLLSSPCLYFNDVEACKEEKFNLSFYSVKTFLCSTFFFI